MFGENIVISSSANKNGNMSSIFFGQKIRFRRRNIFWVKEGHMGVDRRSGRQDAERGTTIGTRERKVNMMTDSLEEKSNSKKETKEPESEWESE